MIDEQTEAQRGAWLVQSHTAGWQRSQVRTQLSTYCSVCARPAFQGGMWRSPWVQETLFISESTQQDSSVPQSSAAETSLRR